MIVGKAKKVQSDPREAGSVLGVDEGQASLRATFVEVIVTVLAVWSYTTEPTAPRKWVAWAGEAKVATNPITKVKIIDFEYRRFIDNSLHS